MSIVSIVKCESYAPGDVRSAVDQAIDLAELRDSLVDRRVLLKPNLLSARKPQDSVTTHPEIVRAIGEIATGSGSRISVGDSPPFAGRSEEKYARLCEITGIAQVARSLDAQLVRFESASHTIVSERGHIYKSFEIADAVSGADVVVNIPKLKTHGLTGFTGAIKNIFGCIPGVRKGFFHVQAAEDRTVFAQMLVDLFALVRPGVHVMDAVVGMDGDGPNNGNPKPIGLILASGDPVALDAVACAVVGIDPLSIETTRLASKQGLGCGDLNDIEIRGECIDDVRVEGFKLSSGRSEWKKIPFPIRRLLRRQLIAIPIIRQRQCTGCGDCVTVCPVNAITAGKPAAINLERCIRCYCCAEVCNFSAIELKRGLIGRLLKSGR